jgi:outer membrane protein assembly factor BamE
MQIKIILISVAIVLSISNCTSYDFARRIVQQGNILSQSRIDKLKPGMSKDEVAILMGSSLLAPSFTQDRWDYAYTWRRGTNDDKIQHLVLYFSNDRLVRILQMH